MNILCKKEYENYMGSPIQTNLNHVNSTTTSLCLHITSYYHNFQQFQKRNELVGWTINQNRVYQVDFAGSAESNCEYHTKLFESNKKIAYWWFTQFFFRCARILRKNGCHSVQAQAQILNNLNNLWIWHYGFGNRYYRIWMTNYELNIGD